MELIKIYKYILRLYARHFNQFIDPSTKIEDKYEDEDKTSSDDKIKLNPYCPKDMIDLKTTDEISVLGDTKRKYVANMIFYDKKIKKAFYYCFDTVFLYNYILQSIAVSVKDKDDEELLNEILIDDVADIPKNPFTNVPFTDEELDEICNKVKFLTDKHTPTYNSHIDIKEAIIQRYMKDVRRLLNTGYLKEPNDLPYNDSIDWKKTRDLLLNYKKKYDDNYLLLNVVKYIYYEDDKIKNTIKGEYRAYIAINFGDISYSNTHLHIINPLVTDNSKDIPYLKDTNKSFILRLPIFTDKGVKGGKDATVLEFLEKVDEDIKVGRYISNDIFPYREDDKPIIKLEPFDFLRNEDVDRLYERFIKYVSKNDYELKGGKQQKRKRRHRTHLIITRNPL